MNSATNFSRVGKNLVATSASSTLVVVELLLENEHLNSKGTLHGGQTAALVDIVTARATQLSLPKGTPMASMEISISYINPISKGDTLIIEGHCLKIGRNVAFTEAILKRKSDHVLVAKGKHTIAILHPPTSTRE